MSDPFWFNKKELLFDKKKLSEFWPSKYQTYEERVNAITRFILYSGIIISLYNHKSDPLVMSILLIAILVVISKSKNKILEKLIYDKKSNCKSPELNNPMGNQLPFDDVYRKPACNSDLVSNQISNELFSEFPTKGLSSINKNFIERQFFSNPNTDIVNDQKGFASSLYGHPNKKMCKTDHDVCTGFEGMQNWKTN